MSTRQTRQFKALIAKLEPELQKAFTQAVNDLRDGIDWEALIQALTAGDIDAAILALNIEPAAFGAYSSASRNAFAAGGALAVQTINLPPASSIKVRFDMSNPAAEEWIKRNVADKIVERDIPETVQVARETILRGYAQGKHPNDIARDLGGSIVGGRREGGVLGLTPNFEQYATSMEARLRSGDPAQMRKVLKMVRRDRSFDKRILKAIESGKPLDVDVVAKAVGRYRDRLVRLRSETVARTETGMAVMSSRQNAWEQSLSKLNLPPEAITKTWRYGGGANDPRAHHQLLNGVSVRGLNAKFNVGGSQMSHALDPSGGAKECANCTCGTDFRIDYTYEA